MSEQNLPPAGEPALSPLKRAFLALEAAQSRVAALETAAREPIAIVGLGCRVPGGANDSDSFWQLMRDGVDAIGPLPADRWDTESLYDPDPETPGRIATRAGGFLGPVNGFDAGFFGIAPREAQGMDPQQRLLLEVAWEALEHAGQAPDRLEGSRTGVYVGVTASDYAYLQLMSGDRALLDAHFTSGMAHSIVSGRLSYLLGLQGPSLTLDTACSSSLVAVHLACQALRAGDCRMALAGGVNLILSPDLYIALSHARMLAPDGRCKTFDASADGFARGEGCGMVVLKRLSDAQADGDRVLAVIRGSAVNQDGPSSGLTAPNGPAQEAVIREALQRAGVSPDEVGYIEAHGTGTQLGDPLEVQALGHVFGSNREQPLWLGSVKTNIGHLEAAAGVTGLIKLVLALQQKQIPRHLHFSTPSPHIPWGDFSLRVPTALTPWEPIQGRRLAGVSSFGFSGTNAHVVVEEAPAEAAPAPALPAKRTHLLALSARDETALAQLAARYADALQSQGDDALADICFTANTGRAHFAQRATVLADSVQSLRERLLALSRGEAVDGVDTARVTRRDPPRVAFLFTGQGAQYAGMGRRLYETEPVFRDALDRCAALLAPHLARPLLEVLFPAEGAATPLDDTGYTQPALFALEYALAEWWRAWGVVPQAAIGHSVGELAAACVAGVFTLEDGLRLIAVRGRLMQALPAGGGMLAVFADEAHAKQAIAPHAGRVSLAAVNGADQTVVSGARESLDAIASELKAQGIRTQALTVSHAFHSPLLDPMLDAFEREAAGVRFAPARLRLVSNLNGDVAGEELTTPAYWRRHAREAVRFGDGLRSLAALRPDVCVEIGPHPTLTTMAGKVWGDQGPTLVASLRKGRADEEQALQAVSALYLAGAGIDWRGNMKGRLITLPSYPFQRERSWFVAKPQAPARAARARDTGHPLLGARLRGAGSETVFESRIGADEPAWMRQHQVQGHAVVPATAYLDTLLAAGQALLGHEAVSVEDITVQEAMLLDDDGTARTLQVVGGAVQANGSASASISSLADDAGDEQPWTTHVSATLRRTTAAPGAAALADAQAACAQPLSTAEFYAGFERRGLDFGPDFRSIRLLWRGDSQALGEVALGDELAAQAGTHRIHPVLLDGCLQVLAAALPDDDEALFLPIAVARFTLHQAPGARCWSHVRVSASGGESARASVSVWRADGALVAELVDVQLKRVSRDALQRLGERWLDDALYETAWRPAPLPLPEATHAVPTPALAEQAMRALGGLRQSARLDGYDAFIPQLEALCAQYVVQTMARLGWAPAPGERVQAEALAARLRVQPRHGRLFARLLAILAEEGLLAHEGDHWVARAAWPAVQPEAELARLHAAHPDAMAELEMTGRVAASMAEALRGEREPMELLFPGGSLANAERMYRDAPTAQVFNGLLGEVMHALLAHQAANPGRPLRVLEIGGGTGGTTARIAPLLPAQGVEYTFTDIGPLFVARAQERFGQHGFMRFQVLDLEKDAAAQGFAPQSFDLVIAANVVHATADLRRTLGRVRGLLAPAGLLAMIEVTQPQRWFDLTVGLTEGWWAFDDTDLRTDYATLPRARWLSLLAECGFADSAALPVGESHTGTLALQSLLLARRTENVQGTWLLMADHHGVADALAARLRERGEDCQLVRPGTAYTSGEDAITIDPASPADHQRLLADLRASGRAPHGVLHAWSLDAAPWDGLSHDGLARAQTLGAVSALHLAQALMGAGSPPPLWVATRGAQASDPLDATLNPAQAPVWGLLKAASLEYPELRCTGVDLEEGGELEALLAELQAGGEARPVPSPTLVAWRGGERHVAQLARARRAAPTVAPRPASYRLVPATRGSLDQLALQPMTRRLPGPGEVEVAVQATGLNFKDVLNVLGMYPGDPGPLGGEFAGRISALGPGVTQLRVGDEVLGVAGGSFASHVIARAEFVQRRPEAMRAEEGAAFPIAFLTAAFCLDHLAGLRAGQRVLIHAAAGGVGMAAVRLAQRAGAEVFATAGAEWKRELLRSMGVAHVMDSRHAGFADEVLALTQGQGVDVVLNSLSGEAIEASFKAIANGGCFVEIGKRDIKTPEWVQGLQRGLRYHVVDWGETGEREPALIGGLLEGLMKDLREGRLAPLPRHAFALDEAERAFRFMAQARHAGKVVVRHDAAAMPPVRRDGTYLITGGLAGLGPVVARWFAQQGAGRLVLLSRRGVTPEVAPVLDEIRALGAEVLAEALDVSDEAALRGLLARLRAGGPPLRGVVHGAGVLDDAGLLQQDASRFARVFAPKVQGGWLLDRLTRSDPLDLFVLFSSVAAVLGSRGQANHSAANALLDVLAHARRAQGLPGLSINWGAWSEVGAAADRRVADRLAGQGIAALTPDQGLLAMSRLMERQTAQAAVLPIDWSRYLSAIGAESPPPFLAGVATGAVENAVAVKAERAAATVDLKQQLEEAPPGRRRALVAAFVRERALRALGVDPARAIDPRTPLGELGLDSLLAVELRNKLGAALGVTLSATLLFDYPTIDALTDHLMSEVLAPAEVEPAPEPELEVAPQQGSASVVDAIEDLSDEEVDRLLALRAQGKR
ncbi:type I polyketide synthase [Hydrogenophaga intermedia]|uniref:JamJ n=1 Tax=Hydrogenophaga intermedia TaxID=65786 RepID=A0A1L1PP51_HYDIT|nr:type I polyketide synthase [Hydrogenophaga intermedia]TMU73243.1 type I polyketide synthase [Hydrogenophaga intermedia]CDN87115.1 JamJ [Hydrogenophaga intermedia]